MNRCLVRCLTGLSKRPKGEAAGREVLDLRIAPDHDANVRLRVDNIESRIIRDFSPGALDLLELAAYIYVADTSISRGRRDPFGEHWYRDMEFVVPVRELGKWKRIRADVEKLLTFLSGDAQVRLEFERHATPRHAGQMYIDFPPDDIGYRGGNTVVLFSGGVDSLAGALTEMASGRVPVLVSHRSAATRAATQVNLVRGLQSAGAPGPYSLSIWSNRIGARQVDVSQRLRGFVYLSLAFAVAAQLGIERVCYFENGISSFNLPLSADRIGSRSSRTTHPRVLASFEELMNEVLGTKIRVENPFLFMSKADVMGKIVELGKAELIAQSVTCSRTIRAARASPNCGTCYQCVMRRFAAEQRGLQNYDPVRIYAKDIFTQELPEGEARATPLQWVGFHQRFLALADDEIEIQFPEIADLYDCLPDDRNESLRKLIALYRKNAQEVMSIVEQKHQIYFQDFIAARLAPHCLISLIGERRHLDPPMFGYVSRISGICEVALRRAFCDSKPRNEAAVKKQLAVAMEAAGERLQQESPSLSYSIVRTTPDFSSTDNRLFIEVKHLKNSQRKTALVDQLLADREKYLSVGAHVLFLVYQDAAFIPDPSELTSRICMDRVFCRVIG